MINDDYLRLGAPFMMECAERTEADKKGGHLAMDLKGSLLLRESAQCPDADEKAFQVFFFLLRLSYKKTGQAVGSRPCGA
jgi:UDP-N-acetylglucosamine pyrophosphorylase